MGSRRTRPGCGVGSAAMAQTRSIDLAGEMAIHSGVMMTRPTYEFDWDDAKAADNERKHGVQFELAMTVFLDPLARTLFDAAHSEDEERWVTVGQVHNGASLVVVHTFTPTGPDTALVRIVSAREATRRERHSYREA